MAAVLVALALGAVLVGVTLRARGASDTATGPVEPIAADDPAYDLDGTAERTAGGGVEPPAASCEADDNEPRLVRYWQDTSGLHVVITIVTTCDSAQVLADPTAQFGLFLGGARLVTGTFDLSSSPVRVPAGGESGEIELTFDGEADFDFGQRGRVVLPSSRERARADGVSLRYRFVCETSDDGASDAQVDSDSGADLGDADVHDSGGDAPMTADPATDAEAEALLQQIHAEDAAARARVSGQWVPQVSAKRIGEETPDYFLDNQVIVHTASVILNRYWAWEDRYDGDAFLLRGSDFPSICKSGNPDCLALWIVAVERPHATGEAVVHEWCEAERLNYFLDGTPIADSTLRNCYGARYSSSTTEPSAVYS